MANQCVSPLSTLTWTLVTPGTRNQPLLHFFHKEFLPTHKGEPGSEMLPPHTGTATLTLGGKVVELNGVKIRFHRYADDGTLLIVKLLINWASFQVRDELRRGSGYLWICPLTVISASYVIV